MGAGCNYTTNGDSDVKAFWLDIGIDENDHENFAQLDAFEYVFNQISELPKVSSGAFDIQNATLDYGEWYEITLESTYDGDGVIINMDIVEGCDQYGLAAHHFESVYRKVCRSVGCNLRRASSGYTSYEVPLADI